MRWSRVPAADLSFENVTATLHGRKWVSFHQGFTWEEGERRVGGEHEACLRASAPLVLRGGCMPEERRELVNDHHGRSERHRGSTAAGRLGGAS